MIVKVDYSSLGCSQAAVHSASDPQMIPDGANTSFDGPGFQYGFWSSIPIRGELRCKKSHLAGSTNMPKLMKTFDRDIRDSGAWPRCQSSIPIKSIVRS